MLERGRGRRRGRRGKVEKGPRWLLEERLRGARRLLLTGRAQRGEESQEDPGEDHDLRKVQARLGRVLAGAEAGADCSKRAGEGTEAGREGGERANEAGERANEGGRGASERGREREGTRAGD